MIRFYKLHPDAILPTKNSGDAGYDLYALETYIIRPGKRILIPTGISVNLAELQQQRHCWPSQFFTPVGLIKDRSGVSSKTGLHTMAGVIDRDYTGEIRVLMVNLSIDNNISATINKGDKIAQMVITVAYDGGVERSDTPFTNQLRGDKGFGSTGS